MQESVDFEWETIVVDNTPFDDGNATPALDLVRELRLPGLLYYHNRENIGSGYNWNRGVELARGEWICFLHDDDELLPHALQNLGRQLRAWRGERPLGYVYARRVDFTGLLHPDPAAEHRRFPPEPLTRFGFMLSGCTGAGAPTCGSAILKRAFMETGGINYDYGLSADEVLCYQIMRDYAVILSDHVLGGYRWGDNESLRVESLIQMIRADELMSDYAFSISAFSRWWGKNFGAAISWRNVYRKEKIARQYGIKVTKKELGSVSVYPKPGCFIRTAFFGLYTSYRFARLCVGLFY